MPLPSRPSSRRTSWTAAVLVGTPLLLTACSDAGSCDRGAPTVDEALAGFLTAVADGDTTAAEAMLVEGATVDPDAFDALRAELEGVPVEDLSTTSDRMGTRHAVAVSSPASGSLGSFEIDAGSEDGCAAVVWGTVPAGPAPAPGESQSASGS